jgi:hypothetical protein
MDKQGSSQFPSKNSLTDEIYFSNAHFEQQLVDGWKQVKVQLSKYSISIGDEQFNFRYIRSIVSESVNEILVLMNHKIFSKIALRHGSNDEVDKLIFNIKCKAEFF